MTKTMSSTFIKLGLLMSLIVTGWMHFVNNNPVSQVYYQPVRIQTGDTLWKIASRYTPEHKDIREVVYEIQAYNNLASAGTLNPGTIIHIPVETSSVNEEITIAVK